METPKALRTLLKRGESARVDFKSSAVGMEELGEAICAFLNSGGGQIVIGATEGGEVEGGVRSNAIEARLRPLSGGSFHGGLISPNAVWDVSEERFEEGTLAIVDVPAGGDPPYVFRDKILVRSGGVNRQATGSEIRSLIEKRYLVGARWERQPAIEVKLSDLDRDEILRTARVAEEKRGWHFRDANDLTAILEDLNLIDHGRLTNAAVVLFAVEAGQIFPQAGVRMTSYSTDKTSAEFADDRVFRGHLFSNLEACESFVKRHVTISSALSASSRTREDSPTLPYWSVREGLRNALIHRDYSSYSGSVSVSIFPRRLEIWSFGGLPPGLEIRSLKTNDRSVPVNPDIAQVVFLRGLVELLGRGTRKMTEEFRSLGLPEPTWKAQAGGILLSLRGGSPPGRLPRELNSRQVELLMRLRPGSSMRIGAVLKESSGKISERTARNDLGRLVKLGFLARQGLGKNTYYVRTEKPIA